MAKAVAASGLIEQPNVSDNLDLMDLAPYSGNI